MSHCASHLSARQAVAVVQELDAVEMRSEVDGRLVPCCGMRLERHEQHGDEEDRRIVEMSGCCHVLQRCQFFELRLKIDSYCSI